MINLAGEIFRKLPQVPFGYHRSQTLCDPNNAWHFAKADDSGIFAFPSERAIAKRIAEASPLLRRAASLYTGSWNPLMDWLKRVETLRELVHSAR